MDYHNLTGQGNMADITNDDVQSRALSQLITDLGMDNFSKDQQNEILIRMTEVLLKRIFLETMEKLGENGREEYEKISQGEVEPEKIEAFFKEKIQNYDEMVQQIVEDFRVEMMQSKA
ncbi:MAG: hypothetical protein ACD_8C00057G0024 [uncultured bacterium]|nr:MAG: hypothetical protein ACD_8C00057G0024 [uncultured bacterium]